MSNRLRGSRLAVILLGAMGLTAVGMDLSQANAADPRPASAGASAFSTVDWIGKDIRIKPRSTVPVDMSAADALAVKELVVRARLDFPSYEGVNPALQVKVNGTVLDFDRVRNRRRRLQMNGGRLQQGSCMLGNIWTIFYSPNFDPIPADSEYAPVEIDPYELRFDVSDLWNRGKKNRVELIEAYLGTYTVVAEMGVSQTRGASMVGPRRPAPTGPIPTMTPITEAHPDYSWRQRSGGAIELKLGDRQWIIESRFSTLAPGWAALAESNATDSQWTSLQLNDHGLRAQAKDFTLERTVVRHDDRLQVIDRITNTSDEDLPVMFAHQTRVERKDGTLYLAGLPTPQKTLDSNNGAHPNGDHPTTLMMWEKSGLGLVGEDDLTRAQGVNFVDHDLIGVRDDRLVVARGKSVALEFSIYPLDSGDRFAFINRVRRNWNTNFTIEGSEWQESSYTPPGMYMDMTDAQLKAQLCNRSARYLLGCVWVFNFEGLSTELTPYNAASLKMLDRAKAVCPDVQRMIYFHAYLGNQDTRALQADPNIAEVERRLFKQDRIERADGTPSDYSTGMPLFLPAEGSTWAKAQERLLEFLLEKTGAEGVFWDETAYSANAYDYNPDHWDGVSAEIDPQTHKITRKVTNLILATQPWRLKMAKKLLSRGPLRGNGPPQTRSFTQLHFPRNVETWTFSNLPSSQLYTPIGMGDHITERDEVDAYRDMVAGLDHGAVYYWYSTAIETTRTTLTSFMFPITPINLGQGYIIARERILTNRSGYFGWGDRSDFDALVFDDRGNQTDRVKVAKVERDGKTFAEIRIPEGYSAALIRK